MLKQEIQVALQELCNEVKEILQERIARYGVNPKIGKNTLQGSELEASIKVKPTENGIALSIADYWEFVSRGWERTHRYEGTFSQFLANVDDWVRRKHITAQGKTQSQLVWAICINIMNYGLRSRPFMVYDEEGDLGKMLPELNDMVDKWFDGLFETLINDLDKFFNDGSDNI